MKEWQNSQVPHNNKLTKSWTKSEETVLIDIVSKYGTKNWIDVSRRINMLPHIKHKTSRQCRDHWLNFANPKIKK